MGQNRDMAHAPPVQLRSILPQYDRVNVSGNVDLLYLVVSCVDGRQIQTIVSHIIARNHIYLGTDKFIEKKG